MDLNFVSLAENYIYSFFKNNAPSTNVYHNLTHVRNVVNMVEEIGINSGISEEEIEILKIAAWFHDIGHIDQWEGHEEKSAEYAEVFLNEHNFPKEKVEIVSNCIKATAIPHKPKNILEEIICDADISHIGSKDFFNQSDLLKIEIEQRGDQKISEFDWIKKNIDFVTQNGFFTKYARVRFEKQKNKNLLKLQKRYKKKIEKKIEVKAKNEKLEVEKEKLAKKELFSKKSERGIETMFRNVIRTHVSFSSMADSKANIMISVNTLLLGAVFTILARKLDSNPHLIIPTLVLSIVSLVTLILAVRVTRPQVSSGVFTQDDIKKRNTNLLFFGNFYKMNLDDFTWGMREMMEDRDFLYGSMIKDFYYLGQVLGKKYKLLRICYTVFMYGITVSALLFAFFLWFYPNANDINNLID